MPIRSKNQHEQPLLIDGDFVCISEDNIPPWHWPIGLIESLYWKWLVSDENENMRTEVNYAINYKITQIGCPKMNQSHCSSTCRRIILDCPVLCSLTRLPVITLPASLPVAPLGALSETIIPISSGFPFRLRGLLCFTFRIISPKVSSALIGSHLEYRPFFEEFWGSNV